MPTEKISKIIREHRLSIRARINSQPVNSATLLSILPFLIGFFQFVADKYQSELIQVFFQKNIPSFSIPTEKINWDTFQYTLKKHPTFFNDIDRIYWYENHFLFEKDSDLKIAQSKNWIAQVTKSKREKPVEISSKNIKYTSTLSELNSKKIENFYLNLDELPSKLESFFEKTKNNGSQRPLLNAFSNFSLSENENEIFLKKRIDIFSKSKPKDQANSLNTNRNNLSNKKISQKPSFQIEPENQFYKLKKNFFQNSELLEFELRDFFFKKGLIPSINFSLKETPNISLLKKFDEKIFLEDLIVLIDEIVLSHDEMTPRRMSGYNYPDMSTSEIGWLFLQRFFSKHKNHKFVKVQLPASFALAKTFELNHDRIPDFLVQSKPIILKDFENDQILYQGPGLLLNPSTGLDWKTQSKNNVFSEQNLRSWLLKYFSPYNALNYFKYNFFGVFKSPEFKNQPIQNLDNPNWLQNLPIYRVGTLSNFEPSSISFETNLQVPFISETDWKKQYSFIKTKTLPKKDSFDTESNYFTFPLIETRSPKNEKIKLLVGLSGKADYEFFSYNKPLIRFFPTTNTILDKDNFGNTLASGVYKKLASVFFENTKSKILFHDIWEPLSYRSWLVVSQLGFAFLVFRILKALADNYGRELLVYLLDLVAALGILDDELKQEIEILMGQREKGFRIIPKITKNFNDIAGIKNLLPEIAEVVWFLRNSAREFSLSKTLPRGILLTGPPGTGKTLLVQALAGEAQVPVLALSGSSLVEPGESGALKLEILFQEARRLAPSIVFIDEIDTLAQKREQVMQNPMGADEVVESLNPSPFLFEKSLTSLFDTSPRVNSNFEVESQMTEHLRAQQDFRQEQLSLLMQFLVELDGIQGRDGVIVIGATNRPEMLDPAVLRPGRFDRIIELGLPGQQKRLEILKLYGKRLGYEETFSWEYLALRTSGFTAADLASIMNESCLKAILSETRHTLETIEHGIDRITTSETIKPTHSTSNENKQITKTRLAYYQAGKIVLSSILDYHPEVLVAHLWPRRTNIRSLQISRNVQKYFFQFARRSELEHHVLGCYAGKAAEILLAHKSKPNFSNLGFDDLAFAQVLIGFIIEKWYCYSKISSIKKIAEISENRNSPEFSSEKIEYFEDISKFIETSPGRFQAKQIELPTAQRPQNYISTAWWQNQVSNELEFVERNFAEWYRIYLSNPEETELNPEWFPPDEFYHRNAMLQELTPGINWNDLYSISRDYQIHCLILESFNQALCLLDKHRELLDRIAYELLQKEILRQPDIEKIFIDFGLGKTKDVSEPTLSSEKQNLNIKIIERSWGSLSRKKISKWIDFDLLNQ